ncbi:MAG: exodeoxyribonuclease VII large subunit, partial [bacterium]
MENEILSVSELRDFINQTLQYAYPSVVVEGEISSFKVNQGKWIFFDIKDAESTIGCFMTKYQLNTVLEDGMLVRVTANPNLTKWGKFSLTVRSVELAGEGSVKRAFEKLKAQFETEGLFAVERKRTLPQIPLQVGLITSVDAAAYNDFVTIARDRWPMMEIKHIQVHVQGVQAPVEVVAAIQQCNQDYPELDSIVIIRGGGSLDDLQAFNDERIVRAIYASAIPTIVGIGHEDDVSLAELAADVRAATPTDAARRLTPELSEVRADIYRQSQRHSEHLGELIRSVRDVINQTLHVFTKVEQRAERVVSDQLSRLELVFDQRLLQWQNQLSMARKTIHAANPTRLLARGYAIARVDEVILTDPQQVQSNKPVMVQL